MKNTLKAKSTASALIAVLSLSTFSLFGPMTSPASASEISKVFEFGQGTANPRSDAETFAVPSGLGVSAAVEFYRLGAEGPENDIPIYIELRSPGVTADTLGRLVANFSNKKATRDRQTVTLAGLPIDRGCALPWRVQVRHAAAGTPPFAVKGTIKVTFTDSSKALDVDPNNINLPKGNKVAKGLQGITGSGTVRIRAEWHTSPLELLHFNSYYKLTVRLKRNGSTVKSADGFSQHAPANKTPKLDFTHFVSPDQAPGNWELEIESFAPADIVDFHINEAGQFSSTFKPGCN